MMRLIRKHLLLASFFILIWIYGVASAQSGKEAEGKAAEQAGRLREALTHYVAALQSVSEGSANDQRLRETIIKLVQKLSPPPEVPEEARRFSVRGQIAIKEAKSPADFDEAAKEFGKAVRLAPWWADGYVNQGVALEKAGKYTEAIRSLKLYLLAAPAAPDTEKIKEQIYALEYRQEKAQSAKAEAERKALEGQRAEEQKKRATEAQAKADEQLAARLVGIWRPPTLEATMGGKKLVMVRAYRIQIQVNGTKVTATCIGTPMSNVEFTASWYHPCNLPYFEATVKGGRLVGTINDISYGSRGQWVDKTNPLNEKIEINADGTWFKLGDVDWDAWKGGDWHKFFGKEK